jgi:hypothetical protein
VERWGRALSNVPVPVIEIPDAPVTLPLRRSAFGTPVVTAFINGHPHEFWLDTGASMTLVSDEVAVSSGVKLAAEDALALGVVAGHIPARAVFIDSLAIGPVVARGLGAALVNRGALRLDHRVVNGIRESVQIDGVIGTDLLRQFDLVIDAARLARTEKYFARHGVKTVFFARFVALLRIFGSLMAGVAHMPFPTFSAVNLAGGFVWAATFSVIGLVFGKNLDRLDDYIAEISVVITVIVILAIAAYWWRERKKERSAE